MGKQIIIVVFMLSVCAWQAHAVVNCTATGAGRQADPADTTCKNYTLCVYVSSNNSYVSYNYVCPTTSLFSPTLAQCTTTYTCPATTTNTTNTTTSVCTADGFIADPNSSNCSSYIECVNINGSYVETTYTCPATTLYNPNTTLCDASYNCTTTTPFTCTTAGRFANTADTTCQTYFYCVLLSDGTFTQYNYTCPSTSLFNPNSRLCTASYTCTN
ncbi:unnamed protein product [Spodoptera littoralis]|uniref:Chitin-binding type-2 domain-containing protein n=1 Tax=Spodoptera littoralis TaxID=7109 RepID=A0A9P0HVL8_SPOLI|nr:unnamed protein product [Spodoptera littoralis]CAH1635317.1 unnamed protein product [Spodoptera littoralis]